MDWHDLRAKYMATLASEGFRPELDSDGDIHFKYEGRHYYITDNCDDGYFHMLYPGFWPISSGEELARVMVAATTATRGTKAAKVWVHSDFKNVSAVLSALISDPGDVRIFVERGVRCIRAAVDTFKDEMR